MAAKACTRTRALLSITHSNTHRLALLSGAAALLALISIDVAEAASNSRRSSTPQWNKAQQKRDVPRRHPFGENMPKGPLQLVVSIAEQRAVLYSNGVRIADTRVSTGTPSHPTPTGVFSVIQKNRWHRSNIYDNAPMYYMHRLTWSGIALHEGHLPGRPASHGCIRLPTDFVSRLWNVSRLGMRVVVAHVDVAPREISHASLFNGPTRPADDTAPVSEFVPQLRAHPQGSDLAPQRHLVQVADARPTDAGIVSNGQGPAAVAVDSVRPDRPETEAAPEFPLPRPAPPRIRTAEPKQRGQVAVFISRKEKRIFVRQAFKPLFDMPVEIAHPEKPFGTHTYTAIEFVDGGARMRWNVISMPRVFAQAAGSGGRTSNRARDARAAPRLIEDARPASDATEALDRVTIPQEAIQRISQLLTPGSSLIISDEGLGRETGRYTEFIVETR